MAFHRSRTCGGDLPANPPAPAATRTRTGPWLPLALLAALAGLEACSEQPPEPTSVTVTPEAATLNAVGNTASFTAVVLDQYGQTMSGVTVAWSSSVPGVATVGGTGVATAVANGSATVTATAGGASGSAAVTVEQIPAAVAIEPDSLVFAALGDSVALAATAADANGHPIPGAEVRWESADESVAAVSQAGVVTSAGNGSADVTATAGEASASVPVTVEQIAATVAIEPDSLVFAALGDSAALAATVVDANGHPVPGVDVESWESADESVAAVSQAGVVTAVANGGAAVTAVAGDVSGSAAVTVEQVPSDLELWPPEVALYEVGETDTLVATVTDANGHPVEDADITWSSDDVSVATVDSDGVVTAAGYGEAAVRARIQELEARSEVVVIRATPDRNREILVELYDATGGDDWHYSEGWKTDRPLGEWYGVWTDDEGYVTEVWLTNNNVGGELPGSLFELGRLESLVLYENRIGGVLPEELGRARELWRLWVSDNQFEGSIPPSLGRLAELRTFGAQYNYLSGSIPTELGNLQQLEELHLQGNALAGAVPPELGQMTALRDLRLEHNKLSGPIPLELGDLQQLEELRLHVNRLSGGIPPELGELTRLKVLNISVNELSGPIPAELGSLQQLEELRLLNNPLSSPIPPELGELTRLKILDMAESELSGQIPGELGDLQHLEELRLSGNDLSGPIPPELGNLSNLVLLSLFTNELTGSIPPELGRLEALETLWIGWNGLTGPIPPELGDMSSLEVLNFGGGTSISGAIPPEVAMMPSLRDFVAFGSLLSGRIPEEFGFAPNLERLQINSTEMEGLAPRSLMDRTLEIFFFSDTDVCSQQDSLFRAWTRTIRSYSPNECGATRVERLALEEFYDRTGGDGWDDNTGWKGSGPVGEWHGVTTSGGRVVKLELPENGLVGSIPGDIANFTELEVLDLSGNDLSGGLPEEVSLLAELTELRIDDNEDLEGILPYSLTGLENLEVLHHDGTDLCAPPGRSFQEWYKEVDDTEGELCDNAESVRLTLPVVYLTQAIQDPEGDVRLVEDRDALLRVFLVGDEERAWYEPEVEAVFSRDGREVHRVTMEREDDLIPTEADESDLDNSYNAVIPAEHIEEGLEMVIEADPDSVVPLKEGSETRFPESGTHELEVVEVPEMELVVVPVLESEDPDSSIFEWTDNIDDDSEEVGLLKHSFPFSGFTARSRETHVTDLDLTTDDGQWGLVLELEALRKDEEATGYWYGAASSVNGYVRGVARLGAWVSMGKAWDTELAHEVGHNLDLLHAPCGGAGGVDPDYPYEDGSIGVWGFDFRDSTLVDPDVRRDIMGYCYDLGWLSDYYFEKVIDYREEAEGGQEGREREGGMAGAETGTLVLWGGVVDGEVRIEPVFPMTATPELPEGPGPYRIDGVGRGGGIDFSLSFTPGEDKYGNRYFLFAIPVDEAWSGTLERITLTGPEGTATLGPGDGRALSVVTDPRTGRIRAFLRDWDGTMPVALGPDRDRLRVATYRGIADALGR